MPESTVIFADKNFDLGKSGIIYYIFRKYNFYIGYIEKR